MLPVAAGLLIATGCGSSGVADRASTATPFAPDVAVSVQAVRNALPDLPYWRGATLRGAPTGDSGVCVERTVTTAAAAGRARTSHVTVSWPGLVLGEALDGPCVRARRFSLFS